MQTFLPYADLRSSAECLDPRRLGKQRVEAYQLLRVLRGETRGWANHPAAKMWRGHEAALGAYMNACIDEWVRRGYVNNMRKARVSRYALPSWFGDDAFHASHRANLLRKDAAYYARFGWTEDPTLPYLWPEPAPVSRAASRKVQVRSPTVPSRAPSVAPRARDARPPPGRVRSARPAL